MKKIALLLVGVVITAFTFSATVTWDGGAATSYWGDDNNWSTNAQPGTGDSVVLAPGQGVICNVTTTVKSITLIGTAPFNACNLYVGFSGDVTGNLTVSDYLTLNVKSNFVIDDGDATVGKVNIGSGCVLDVTASDQLTITDSYTKSGNCFIFRYR